MGYAAVRTGPFADVQGLLAVAVSAGGTESGGRVESVRLDERSAFPFGFVRQLSAEFIPTDIPDRFRKFVVLHHIRTLQRLDHDDLVFVRDSVGEVVQEVLALVRDLFMVFGQHQTGLFPVPAAFLLISILLGFKKRPSDFMLGNPVSTMLFVSGILNVFAAHGTISTNLLASDPLALLGAFSLKLLAYAAFSNGSIRERNL